MNQESYNQGLARAAQKDYIGAINNFTQALQIAPNFTAAYFRRGLAYYNLGQILQAVSDYTEVLRLNPDAETYYARALARLTLKNLPGALDDVEQALNLNGKYAAAYDLRGVVQRKQGQMQAAIANFKQAAELYLEQKDKENCRLCLEKIKQLQPPLIVPSTVNPTPIRSEQDYFSQLLEKAYDDADRAMEDLNWILKVDPQDAQAYCCRGVVWCKLGNYRDAISDFNQALQLNFTAAIVYRNRGKARFQLGDLQGAIADFNLGIQMEPQEVLFYIARGDVYHATGNYSGAIKDYNQALQIAPDYAQAYYHRGMSYACLEEMQHAVEDYQRALSIFCDKQDWDNYQKVLDKLEKISLPSPKLKKTSNLSRQRLLKLVGGHWEIAQRLIEQAKNYHPGMSEEWYMEKVIDDLERERGR